LNIAGNNISSGIPPEIGNAAQLQALDLSSINQWGGSKGIGKVKFVEIFKWKSNLFLQNLDY
jgi:hypothetical protein